MTNGLNVTVLRELFRNLQAWKAAYETDGIDCINAPNGHIYSLWDIEYLYSQIYRLSPRQREAITLCLYLNVKEVEAAKMMGVSETNPVAMYATLGMKRLIEMMDTGQLPRFQPEVAA